MPFIGLGDELNPAVPGAWLAPAPVNGLFGGTSGRMLRQPVTVVDIVRASARLHPAIVRLSRSIGNAPRFVPSALVSESRSIPRMSPAASLAKWGDRGLARGGRPQSVETRCGAKDGTRRRRRIRTGFPAMGADSADSPSPIRGGS